MDFGKEVARSRVDASSAARQEVRAASRAGAASRSHAVSPPDFYRSEVLLNWSEEKLLVETSQFYL